MLTPIAFLINQYLRLDPETFARLAHLSGKTVALEIRGFPKLIYLLTTTEGIQLTFEKTDKTSEPDTTISGTPFALLQLIKSGAHHITRLSKDLSVTGNLELAQEIQTIFQEIDIDWEEHLSHIIGDVAAHQVGNIARGAANYGRQLAKNFHRTGTEYLQEELRFLPPSEEVQDFMAFIDETRDAVERLEARVQQLERKWQS